MPFDRYKPWRRPSEAPGPGRGALVRRAKPLGLTALVTALGGCAAAFAQDVAAPTTNPAPPSLGARLEALSEKYVGEAQPSRDPARIRAQIASLEARRFKLLERYTPTHPGVLQIDRQIRILQEQLAAAEVAQVTTAPPAP